MNEQSKNTDPEDIEITRKLNAVAERTNANAHFLTELEHKLKEAHKPKTSWSMPGFKKITPALAWFGLVVLFGLALGWSIRNLIPSVQPASNSTATPAIFNNTPTFTATPGTDPITTLEVGSYDWRRTKLNLEQPLPDSPTEAQVYLLKLHRPATADDVQVLAQGFATQGDVQEMTFNSSTDPGYMVTDGTQRLEMQANHHFVFYTNYPAPASGTVSDEQARIAIDNFLKKYGFDFEYHIESVPEITPQQYVILPLTPDGTEIRSDYLMPIRYEVVIDGTGQILAFSGFPLDYEAVGTFQLITAEEAFQTVLNDTPQFGRMESVRGNGGGGGGGHGFYKLNLSGTPVPFPTAITQPNVVQSSTEYIVKEGDTLFAIAQDYGITPEKIFEANGFSDSDVLMPGMTLIIPGTQLDSEGYAYTVVAGDTCQSIANTFNVSIDNLIANNILPADCSTLAIDQVLVIPAAQSSSDSPYIGKRLEDQRGIVVVNIYRKPDGSQRTEYIFITAQDGQGFNLALKGDGLQELEKYHNLPINIWATIESMDEFGMLTAHVDRFVVPFPDLQIQIFQGKQKTIQIDDLPAVLFTTADGTTYIQAILNGDPFVDNITLGVEGDEILLEAIHIPDDFHSGYPVLRIFSASIANPNNNETTEMLVTADQPYIMDDIPIDEGFIPPIARIEKVELVYYLPNLQSGNLNTGADAMYMQPAWRFYGHYSTGDEFEFLIQALKQEFLFPELAPYTPPG